MKYTVTNKTDADLAGLEGRLVMHFVDGSAIEVTPEEVEELANNAHTQIEQTRGDNDVKHTLD